MEVSKEEHVLMVEANVVNTQMKRLPHPPTVSKDSVMPILIAAAIERQDVAMDGVAGAFLKVDMDDVILMKLEETTVDIMCELNPGLKNFISIEKGKRVL